MSKYVFTSDPGHGWLRVPMAELVEMGIADKISQYSYISANRRFAYLEEDCDLSVFITHRVNTVDPEVRRAWIRENITFKTVERTTIRNLTTYAVMLPLGNAKVA
jgi:hypothetical protein